jgi:3D-(3,5/4)-trihydroxycyclohexane-1,2-dione acylhydrolase (decyclizing)
VTNATIRLTMAQALVRYLAAQRVETAEGSVPLFGGVFAIFGHGNVAGVGEALYRIATICPPPRAQRAGDGACGHRLCQARMRRRMMACTTSIGPGATNLVTAAALAHVNRLPVLLLPGDVFVRAPDRCCNRSKTSRTVPCRRTTACGRCRAISIASSVPSNC